jgi:hypothetical protein
LFVSLAQAVDLVPFALKNGKWGLFDRNANRIMPEQFDAVIPGKYNLLMLANEKKWSAIRRNGTPLFSQPYKRILELENGLILAGDETYRLFFPDGKPFMSQEVKWATVMEDNVRIVICRKDGKIGVCQPDGKIILPFDFDYAPVAYAENLYRIRVLEKGKVRMGLLDAELNPILPCVYFECGRINVNLFYGAMENGEVALLIKEGKVLGRAKNFFAMDILLPSMLITANEDGYSTVYNFKGDSLNGNGVDLFPSGDKAIVHTKKGDALFHASGKTVWFKGKLIERIHNTSEYLKIQSPERDKEDGGRPKFGLATMDGKIIFEERFADIRAVVNPLVVVGDLINKDGKTRMLYGLYDFKKKSFAVPQSYEDILLFSNGRYALKENNTYTIYEANHRKSSEKYSQISYWNMMSKPDSTAYYQCYAMLDHTEKTPNRLGLLDAHGNEVLHPEYESIEKLKSYYNENEKPENFRFVVRKKDGDTYQSAVFDKNMKQITPFQFTYMVYHYGDFLFGGVAEKSGDKPLMMITDRKGNKVIPRLIHSIERLYPWGMIVKIDDTVFAFDWKGNEVASYVGNGINWHEPEYLHTYFKGKHGLMDNKGKTILPAEYDWVKTGFLEGSLFQVKMGNLVYYTDASQKIYME